MHIKIKASTLELPRPLAGEGWGEGLGLDNTKQLKIDLPSKNMLWVLYLLLCKNGHYYAGITNDLQARFDTHLSGKGARYTRANPPVRIIASKPYPDRSSASVAEAQLKNLPRSKKLGFFDGWLYEE